MAAPLLAEAVGGKPFLGFISAVAFATILAVVAGLTLSGAAALSHDLWVNVVRGGHADRSASSCVVARMRHGRAGRRSRSCWASSSRVRTWPTWWAGVRDCREREFPGAACSRSSGAASRRAARSAACSSARSSSLVLIYLSPTIQIDILKQTPAPFPLAKSRHRLDPAVVRDWRHCRDRLSGA